MLSMTPTKLAFPISVCLMAIGFCSPATSSVVANDVASDEVDPPNIVLIISDDAGYADFSMHGSRHFKTPNIDLLAEQGIRCLQGYVSASVCSPSRAGLMTGRYQQRFGHEFNIPPQFSETNGLPLSEQTMAEVLKAQGYRTIALGKWHLGYADHFHPLSRGFSDYYGFLQGSRSYWPIKGNRLNRLLQDREPIEEDFEYMTDELGRKASEYIRQTEDQPFFIYLSYNAVHTPMHALPADLEAAGPKQKARKQLSAMTAAMDRSIGNVLAALEQKGVTDNTLVVFINDNGGATSNRSSNGKLRGHKGTLYEGGIRVPFVVRWPARFPANKKFPYPVSTLDLLPTFLAAAGGETGSSSKNLDGVDLLPFFSSSETSRPHDLLHWRQGDNWACMRDDLKLVFRPGDSDSPMLFDLSKDRSETTDLAQERPKVVKQLLSEHQSWNKELIDAKWRYRTRKKTESSK